MMHGQKNIKIHKNNIARCNLHGYINIFTTDVSLVQIRDCKPEHNSVLLSLITRFHVGVRVDYQIIRSGKKEADAAF